MKYSYLTVLISTIFLAACAGGGSSGGSSSSGMTPAQFQTPEYNAQYGLGMVNAANLYAKNGNGSGVKVAVFDSGINPAEAQTGSSIKIDTANSYDYVTNTAGSSSDPNGHGTHVSGIIAAPKNDSGMHGIAYNSTLLNMRIYNSAGFVSDGQIAAGVNRSLAAGAMILNNSWGGGSMSGSLVTAYANFVANGGVVVFAAGNNNGAQPTLQASLPNYVSGLQAGWLAVMAVDSSGTKANYSNVCGVAKAYCLAAPGSGIYSMWNNGGYNTISGTSMATPMVSGALASLKSAFPNLSYQQVRDRLLITANKTGIYANSDIYGQGLMDLNGALSPLGGLSIPTTSSANGVVSSATNSKIVLPAGLASSVRGQKMLMVDGYQRAPFFVSSNALVSNNASRGDLGIQHLNDLSTALPIEGTHMEGVRYSYTRDMNAALSLTHRTHQFAFSTGTRSEATISRSLGFAHVPHLTDSGTNSNGLGYATSLSGVKVGMIASTPNTQQLSFGNTNLTDRSLMGTRTAYSVVAQKNHEMLSYGGTYTMANNFSQPAGLMGSGAFSLGGSGAISTGAFLTHKLFDQNTSVLYAAEVTSLSTANNGLTSIANAKYASLKSSITHVLDDSTSLSFGVKQQQATGGQMSVRLPSSIDETGSVGYQNYSTGFNNLINSAQLNFDISHRINKVSRIRSGVIYQQLPYGQKNTGFGTFYEHRL